jgi:hypothetical protein
MNPQKQQKIDSLIQQGYELDIMECINQGWEVQRQNLGGFIGFALLFVFLYYVSFCFCAIPLLFQGNLAAGYFIVAMKIQKRQPIAFENFFDGFRNSNFSQIFLENLILVAIYFVASLPSNIISFSTGFINGVTNGGTSDGSQDPGLIVFIYLLAIVGSCIIAFFNVLYTFAIPLIIDQRVEFWPAMELSRKIVLKRLGSLLLLHILMLLINIAAIFTCGIGWLFTCPLYFCSIMAAYNKVIGYDESRLASS